MAKYVELRRHTDADRDVLTLEGVRAAVEIGGTLRCVTRFPAYRCLVKQRRWAEAVYLYAIRPLNPSGAREKGRTNATPLGREEESVRRR
jgi:hypothetical protein